MIVVIDAKCTTIPEGSQELATYGMALLNMLFVLGYDPFAPPLASLLKKQRSLTGEWAIVSPIHWQASHNDALIVGVGSDLGLTEDEAKSWFKLYAEYLAEEGMSLYYYAADLWLLCIDNKPSLHAKPVYQLVHRSYMPELSLLDKTMYWQKFITESQMLFASVANTSTLNGVWVWGHGPLKKQPFIKVCADETFFEIASLTGANIVLYHPEVSLKEFQLLLLGNMNTLTKAHQQELKSGSVSWYWNNRAYVQSKNNWFKRIWRTLFHAHKTTTNSSSTKG